MEEERIIENKNGIIKLDKNGNTIYEKNCIGDECWFSYDQKGNCIYSKNNLGHEYYYENYKGRKLEISKEEFEKKEINNN